MLKFRIIKYKSTTCKCIGNFIEAFFYTSGLHSQILLSCYNLRFSSAAASYHLSQQTEATQSIWSCLVYYFTDYKKAKSNITFYCRHVFISL